VYLEKGTFFGEQFVFGDDRAFGDRQPIIATLDRLVAKEISFKLTCKSLEGIILSISVDEFLRLMQTKDDPTLRKLRN
jgi:CRP-like cAMP-binding protein